MKYRVVKGYKYQLVDTLSVQLCDAFKRFDIKTEFITLKDGKLTLARGYAWDGPSGPTIDTATFMRGSAIHDALYQLIREGLIGGQFRYYADAELKRVCLMDGMCRLRAWYVFQCLRRFAAGSIKEEFKPRGRIVEI